MGITSTTGRRARQDLADSLAHALAPFHLLSLPGISASEQGCWAEHWMTGRLRASADDRAMPAGEFAAAPQERFGAGRLRLGYLSCDFHQHATALLMVEMLEAHDRECFELFAYSYSYSYGADDGQGMRQRIERRFDRFTDITALSDVAAARAIHADGIDILVDLKGYTAGTRTALLTYRPASVQVNFLGYPDTLGGGFCDYIIGDRFVTPAGKADDYGESMKRGVLPHRLVFAPDLPQPEHLARPQLPDLVLDTSPCNAHTTAP